MLASPFASFIQSGWTPTLFARQLVNFEHRFGRHGNILPNDSHALSIAARKSSAVVTQPGSGLRREMALAKKIGELFLCSFTGKHHLCFSKPVRRNSIPEFLRFIKINQSASKVCRSICDKNVFFVLQGHSFYCQRSRHHWHAESHALIDFAFHSGAIAQRRNG